MTDEDSFVVQISRSFNNREIQTNLMVRNKQLVLFFLNREKRSKVSDLNKLNFRYDNNNKQHK